MSNDVYHNQGQVGGMGANVQAQDIAFYQTVNVGNQTINWVDLVQQLGELKQAILSRRDSSPEAMIASLRVEEAQIAALEKNPSKMMAQLKAAGEWLRDFAKEVGKDLVVEVITQSLKG